MIIDRADGWHRKKRKCEYCSKDIMKDEEIILLFAEVIKFPVVYRGIAFHKECAKEQLYDLLDEIN